MSQSLTFYGRLLGTVAVAAIIIATPALAHPTIDIAASNWKFTPATITVNAGEATTLRLTSTGGVHGIASDELSIPDTMIQPGQFVEVTFTPKTPGTYTVHCSVYCGVGHPNMALTIVVKGTAAATTAPTATAAAPATPAAQATPSGAVKATPKPMIDDRHFIIMMIQHDQMGIRLVQLAVKSSKRHELRALEQTSIAHDTSAIAQLKSWYKMWYHSTVPSMMSMPMMQHAGMPMMPMMAMSPSDLTNAPDFDRAFLGLAIHHSAMGAGLSAMAVNGLTHRELREFARTTASAQLIIASELWHWYEQWYPEAQTH